MKRALKTYQIELKVCGPVFIGSGLEIQKKEYLFLNKQTIGIIDVEKLYAFAKKKRLAAEFERFMVVDTKEDLKHWAERNRLSMNDIESCLKYKVHAGDIQREKGRMQIMSCIKDPYGMPYVPGSSLKGMLRTILLCNELLQNPEKFRKVVQQMKMDLEEPVKNRKQVLVKSAAALENQVFRTLTRDEENKTSAVNDKMSAIVIGDSEPLSVDDLILCQKWEHHQDGSCKTLNLLRECVKPGTVIRATMTVDESLISITADDIKKAVESVYDCYYNCFQRKFSKTDRKSKQTVFLGGGSGFVSKTVLYSLLEEQDAVRTISNIFLKTGVPREHKHYQDIKLGVSPHVLKCTRYRGKEYMMGQCELKIT